MEKRWGPEPRRPDALVLMLLGKDKWRRLAAARLCECGKEPGFGTIFSSRNRLCARKAHPTSFVRSGASNPGPTPHAARSSREELTHSASGCPGIYSSGACTQLLRSPRLRTIDQEILRSILHSGSHGFDDPPTLTRTTEPCHQA
jgi:hypothetical protein